MEWPIRKDVILQNHPSLELSVFLTELLSETLCTCKFMLLFFFTLKN